MAAMRNLARAAVCLAVMAGAAAAPRPAHAADSKAPAAAAPVAPKPPDAKAEAMAKKLVARAELALKDSRFDEAIDLYKQAYALARHPADLLLLGRLQRERAERLFTPGATADALALAKVGYLEARTNLVEWTKLAPDAPVHAEILIAIDDIDSKLKRVNELLAPKKAGGPAEVRVGRIVVTANMDGASVLLDGVKVGRTPLSLDAVEIGTHTVAVAKLGTSPFTTSVVVEADRTVELSVELEGLKPIDVPSGGDGAGGGGAGGALGGAGGGGPGGTGAGTGATPAGAGILGRWWFWTGVGVVVVGLGIAVGYAAAGGVPGLPPGPPLTFPGERRIFGDR
jgi:hypothetical protein